MDFGFKIAPSSTVNLDAADTSLYNKLVEIAPDAKVCMSCGSCGATCTSAERGMSDRKVILGLQRGKDVSGMLNSCMLCGKCTMVCPRGINTRHLILSLCRIYDKEGLK